MRGRVDLAGPPGVARRFRALNLTVDAAGVMAAMRSMSDAVRTHVWSSALAGRVMRKMLSTQSRPRGLTAE